MTEETSLAATLRTWRERLSAEAVGLHHAGARRTVGLRREELASLAGVSVDYIVRLEQGRATAPSGEVLGSLARGLRLDRKERDHLYNLAGLSPPGDRRISERITPGVQRLLDRLGDTAVAAFAADWRMIQWSPTWAALLGDPSTVAPADRNFVLHRFPEPGGRANLCAWPMRIANAEQSERAVVANVRRACAVYPDDPRIAELFARAMKNERFAQLWRDGAVGEHLEDHKVLEHPVVGEIELDCDVLVAGDEDLKIVALTAEPGSESAKRIERLLT
ncbi:MAG TPA: helix-turn-helix transcriptional regulator [Kofleriaceae bacterium]